MTTTKAINGRKIELVCTIHGTMYGVRPIHSPQAVSQSGFCDICEATGQIKTPQTVRPVSAHNGIRKTPGLIVDYIEPKP